MKKVVEYTLSKGNEFLWYYDGEKLTIERTFKNKEEKSEFYNDEIDMIIQYIASNGQVDLSNSVSKVKDGTEKPGIGKFIYYNIREDTTFQQSSSQFVTIMFSIGVLHYNNKKRNMKFWIKDLNWKEKISAFCEKV